MAKRYTTRTGTRGRGEVVVLLIASLFSAPATVVLAAAGLGLALAMTFGVLVRKFARQSGQSPGRSLWEGIKTSARYVGDLLSP